MFIAANTPSNTLRSVRSEISFQPGDKHLAPLGEIPPVLILRWRS